MQKHGVRPLHSNDSLRHPAGGESIRIAALEAELHATQAELATKLKTLRETQTRLDREIAERKRIIGERDTTERRLRDSEETFRKLFDYNLDSMTISDVAERKIIDINEEYIRHTGYRREEVIGLRTRELDPFYDPEEAARFIQTLKTHLVVRNMEVRFKRRDGTPYPVLVSAIIMQLGGRPRCVTISRDISTLKETERQLVEAREAALAASQAKSQFLSAMSHEIRTPLNAVLGMADLLWESRLDAEQRRYLEIMCTNGAALLDLINDILDLAKVESGHLVLEKTEFDLREAIDKAADTISVRAHEKRLELAVRIVPNVPQRIVGDPMRLRQMLLNLLGNAVKFTESGEVVLTVEVADRHSGTGDALLRFSVSDTGVGIPADKIGAIFSPFTQADSSTARKFGGSGLGLAIVKRLVELHNGEISVRSELDRGSTFSFTAQFGVPPDLANLASAPGRELKDVRVLVIDDTAANR
ncbi:MAG TPA: ATP-binding protein, partial [Candidatus Binataceae bacterium]|nr:ATP-binding protein [Candidatus Binataceae bacterium]